MSFSGPFRIVVKSRPELDATTTSLDCAPVTFRIPSGGQFDIWTFRPNPGGPNGVFSGQFVNKANGGFITARNGAAVACRHPGSQDQTLWQVLDNRDGTYLIAIPDAKLIWSVDGQGRLVIADAQRPITDSERFIFPKA